MKWLVREKLASWMRIRIPPTTPITPSSVSCKRDGDDDGDFQQNGTRLQDVSLKSTETADRETKRTHTLLLKLLELQRGKMRSETAEDPDREKKDDWKLAAAVFDRILCIVFGILLVGGTIIFFITFGVAYKADN